MAGQESLLAFVPPTIVDQTAALADCPYCGAFPSIPCVLHRDRDDD